MPPFARYGRGEAESDMPPMPPCTMGTVAVRSPIFSGFISVRISMLIALSGDKDI